MTADPVRPQETLRDAVRDAAMTPLHQLKVQISGLRDCACGIVAEVVADSVLPIVEEETTRQLAALRDKVKTLAGELAVKADEADGATWKPNLSTHEEFEFRGIALTFRKTSTLLLALVEEPQGGEQ